MKRPLASLGSALLLGIMIGFICLGDGVLDGERFVVAGTVAEAVEQTAGCQVLLVNLSVRQPDEKDSNEPDDRRVHFNAKVFLEEPSAGGFGLLPGDRAVIEMTSKGSNLSRGTGLEGKGVILESNRPRFSFRRWLYTVNQRLSMQLENLLPAETAGPLMTMLLGNDALLDEDIRLGYQSSGLSHLLAISGLHVSLLGFGLFALLKKSIGSLKASAGIAILFTWFFCLMTQAHISTVRASVMLTVQLLSHFTFRRYDGKSSLFFTLLTMLVWKPWQLFNIGFQLSFLAVGGILYLYKPLVSRWGNRGWVKPVALVTSVNLATYPVLANTFHQFPVYSLFANLLVVPFMGLVVGAGSIALAVSFLSMKAGAFLAGSCHYLLTAINVINGIVAELPSSTVSTGVMDWIAWTVFLAVCAVLLIKPALRPVLIGIGSSAVFVLLASSIWQGEVLEVSMLDVGQGDSIAVQYSGKTWLVDGGGWTGKEEGNTGKYVLLPYLRAEGCNSLEGVFVTHSDFDHIYGIIELLDYMDCKNLYLPVSYRFNRDSLLEKLLEVADETDTAVVYLSAGDIYTFGRLEMICLSAGMVGENNNNQSLVMRLAFRDFDMLLMGDAERELEEALLTTEKLEKVEVLKVGHHGSATSSGEAFLKAIQPGTALISVGANNRFGHPSGDVTRRLENQGADIYTTMECGEIDIWTAGFGGIYICVP